MQSVIAQKLHTRILRNAGPQKLRPLFGDAGDILQFFGLNLPHLRVDKLFEGGETCRAFGHSKGLVKSV